MRHLKNNLTLGLILLISYTVFSQHLPKPLPLKVEEVTRIARVTGRSLETEEFSNPNRTVKDFDIGGTDLGIIWALDSSRVGIFFGDTYGSDFKVGQGAGHGSNWRSNVVAFSEDLELDDGMLLSGMLLDEEGKAREICAGAKTLPGDYQTSIPTSAIHAGELEVVHYMNIYDWEAPEGRWLTNFSSLYFSSDRGQHWERAEEVRFEPDSHFSQVSYGKKNGMVYMVGVQSGRGGDAYLARFREADILNKNKYQYWNGDSEKWVQDDESAATVIIPGPVGEGSLLFHEKYKRWFFAYSREHILQESPKKVKHQLVLREAKELNGEWSEPEILVTDQEYPGLYAPYLHPLKNKGDDLFFTMSIWNPYNVFLMKAELGVGKEGDK